MLPGLAVQGVFEPVDRRPALSPVDFQAAEDRLLAKINLKPRLVRPARDPGRRIEVVDGEACLAAARARPPSALVGNAHARSFNWRKPVRAPTPMGLRERAYR